MVKERELPKGPLSQTQSNQPAMDPNGYPEFGKPSSLQPQKQSNIFNIPKPNQPRPEHHRPHSIIPKHAGTRVDVNTQPAAVRGGTDIFVIDRPSNFPLVNSGPTTAPLFSSKPTVPASKNPDVVEISRPSNFPVLSSRPAGPLPVFSSQTSTYNSTSLDTRIGNGAGLTVVGMDYGASVDVFDPNYGSFDPSVYVDSAKANENIKALLEGAFEEEDDKPKTRLRKKKAQSGLDALADQLKGITVSDKRVEEGLASEDEEEDDGAIEGLEVKLLPHQIDGVAWMRDKEFGTKKIRGLLPKGGILADDMGLGKTIQSIALILTNTKPPQSELKDNDKRKLHPDTHNATLVVAPLALIKQWEAEIKEKVSRSHRLNVYVHHGPQRHQRASDLKKYDVVITTYQTLASEHGHSGNGLNVGCFGVHWYRLILDEAHSIKNRNAKATKACCALKSEYRWCLTGTPMQNNLDELQSLINFLRIKPYNDLSVWRDQITRPMQSGRGGVAIRRLQVYLKAFMKRRTKDVLKKDGALSTGTGQFNKDPANTFQITKRQIEKIEVEFSPKEQEFYDRFERRAGRSLDQMVNAEALNYASALVLLLRLRQACNSPTLVTRSLAKDKDALSTGSAGKSSGSQSPRKANNADDDMDGIAAMLGGLSVVNKKCDVCQIQLTKEERSSGAIRCTECERDLKSQTSNSTREKNAKKYKSKTSQALKMEAPVRQNRRRVVMDSDDEEDEGEWIVSKDKQNTPDLGQAGGTDGEDAEGGGEWLKSDDSDSEDEVKPKPKTSRKKIVNLDSSDEDDDDTGDDDEHEHESDISLHNTVKNIVLSTKIRNLLEILNRESGKYKFIVFSQFTTMLDLIEPFLKRDGLVFTRYDGSMRNDQREASLEQLRNSPRTRILLCSLRCGSLGLNLTAASRVVILEPFWNPVSFLRNVLECVADT